MGKFRAWRRWAVTGLVLALVFSGTGSRVVEVSADPGDNGATPVTAPSEGTVSPAVAVPIGTVWQEFSFTAVGVDARGCFPNDPAGLGCTAGVNSTFVGAPPWTFTAPAGGAVLQVTDAFFTGDRFEIFDFGVSQGQTGVPGAADCGPDPDPCFASVGSNSHGVFPMAAGPHSITIRPTVSPFGSGAAYFRVITVPARCTVNQTLGYAGGNLSLGYTLGNTVPVTWNLYIVIGNTVTPLISAPLPVIDPPIAVGPFAFPFPPSGGVGFLTTMTTPTGGILCSDFDVVNTGPAAAGADAPAAPRIEIPVPSGDNGLAR